MPLTKITTTMTQNGVEKPLECVIHEVNDEPIFVTLEGGPFHGERFTRYDLTNLILELEDLRTAMKEVADGSKS
jgi:hypothetical protein